MNFKKFDKKKITNTAVLLLLITFSMFFQISWIRNQLIDAEYNKVLTPEKNILQTSETDYYSDDWISNGDFSSGSSNWYSEISGDTTDANAYIGSGDANYVVEGNTGTFSFIQDPISNSDGKWIEIEDPYFPSAFDPDDYGFDPSDGFYFSHTFDENNNQYTQLASKVFARNLTVSQNLSDYIITSASVSAYINASVHRDVDVDGDSVTNPDNYDVSRFFLLLSDLDRSIIYEAGYFQDETLGEDDGSTYDTISDTELTLVSDETLKFYLTNLLSQDNQNFSIAIGIRIFSADNFQLDRDRWDYLVFRNVSLSFTYEKKIDQESKISWNQDGSTIPSNYEIENATLNFQYRIDNDWITSTSSVNSEFRIIINNNQLGETVKLSTATGTYKYFKTGGLDVSNFIVANEEVNLSIQVYIGDEFTLDTDVTITIDDVTLIIWYGISTEPDVSTYDLILNDVDRTTEKSTQVTYGEIVNITFVYKNSTGDFIPDADVQLTGSGFPAMPLSQDLANEQYEKIIDSTDLGVGTSYLTLTASKKYHTSQNFQITITVISRDTELQLFLNDVNQTLDKEISIQWDENLNITIKYMDVDNSPKTHIGGATVELTGAGASKILIEDGPNEQYEYPINTKILGTGSTYLTVYASKDNYTSLNIRFKVTVTTRTTYLDNIELGLETDLSIEIEWNELFDVSVSYKDFVTDNYITGAVVQLIGTNYLKTLTPAGNLYTWSVDTFDLSIGNNFLTILAQKDNYSIASELITVIVDERATTIETILNHTSTTTISYPFGEQLNITAVYSDHLGPFIDGALVELREGSTAIYPLTRTGGIDQYSVIINTDALGIGVNLLTIYAKQNNYSAAFASITITINERDTRLEIYLDEIMTTVAEKSYNELLNITVVYKDFTDTFIDGANCELRRGETVLYTILKHPSFDQYSITINTKYLDLGTNLLAIYANLDNYSAALVSITIIVAEKDTILDIILDGTHTTTVEVIYGELVNITAIYQDTFGTFIDNAVVQLRDGVTVIDTLSKHPSLNQYGVTINSNKFSLRGNVFSIYAKKDNYSVSLLTILITVNERSTTLDVLINGIDSNTFEFYNVSINQSLNFTAIYNDFTDVFISGATVELTGSDISEILAPDVSFDQYTYTLDAIRLGIGVHFLVVSASQQNYTISIKNIKINVLERASTLELYVDNVNLTSGKYIETEIDKVLNITVFFTDAGDSSYISGATIRVTGGTLNEFLTENVILQQYNISVRTNDLNQGINFLTIFAQKANYESRSILLTVEVKEKISNLRLFLNESNQTIGKSIEVTITDFVNVTVIYEDYSGIFIDGAEIKIVGEGLEDLYVNKSLLYDQYEVSIDTLDLNFGINLLTLYAKKDNYQPQTLIIRIEINEKETDMEIYLNGLPKTIDRTINLPIGALLNITIKYVDFDNKTHIPGSVIELVGEDLPPTYLTEYPAFGQYSISLSTTLLDIGVRFLTVYATHANFQSYSALLRIQVDRIQTNISTTSGAIVFNRQPGNNFQLEIQLRDLDFNTNVLNANVSYTWVYGQGTLTDPDNDGIYVTTLTNLRAGTFQITISVYAGDDYDFERFYITLNVIRPPEDVLLFQILTITGIAAAVGISAYLLAYQRVLKYPKQVRKIRKYKSKLKKSKSLGIQTLSRDELIDKTYAEKIHPLEKQFKGKMAPQSSDNNIQKDTLESSENLKSN